MFPDINIDVNKLIETITLDEQQLDKLGRVPLFDFDKNVYVAEGGRLIYATEIEAVEQWIKFLILSELDKYNIYKETGFGLKSGYEIIGYKQAPKGYLESNLKLELSEKIKAHKLITRVYDFTFNRDGDLLTINFSIDSSAGTIRSEVSI